MRLASGGAHGRSTTRYCARRAERILLHGDGWLGVSLAGFAGLISTFDQRPMARSAVAAYRITGIIHNTLRDAARANVVEAEPESIAEA